MSSILGFDTYDVRFPTSLRLDGSDAMNPSPDYSAAYVVIRTDAADPVEPGAALAGHAFVFTIGRGNDVQLAAIRTLEPFLAGLDVDEALGDLGALYRRLVFDSPLRWLGPECGVVHMAIGAVVNACWDMAARRAGKPLWLLLAELRPAEIVGLIDFRYLTDALTPEDALRLLEQGRDGMAERIALLRRDGYPAYSTTPGWLGYSDDKLASLCAEAVDDGFTQVKIKVGARLADDKRRIAIAREAVGDKIGIAIDANQVWDVPAAISWVRELAPAQPAWIEEPTSPGDILGMAAIRNGVWPVKVASGEHGANRVVFKQLLQARAIDVMQIDACRVAGVNENLANLLLAAKFGVPVCPHAGGVGLCEIVQHLSMFDYVALTGTTQGRMIEWIDHLHEHFVTPAVVTAGRYLDRLRAEGTIRAVGVGMNQAPLLEWFVERADLDCVLVTGRYSLLDTRAAASLFPACQRRGVAVLAAGVFNSGILADPRPGATYNYAPAPAGLVDRAQRIRAVCARHGVPIGAAAIRFALRHPAVTAVVVGARSAAEVTEDVRYLAADVPEGLFGDLAAEGLTPAADPS